jgi:hypothetical protein
LRVTDIQAWANGETNHGWAFLGWPNASDGTAFSASEATNAADRPLGPTGPGKTSIGSLLSSSGSGVQVVSDSLNPAFGVDPLFPQSLPDASVMLWPTSLTPPDPTASLAASGPGSEVYEIPVGTVTLRGITGAGSGKLRSTRASWSSL